MRKTDALITVPIVLTDVLQLLILFISYVNSITVLKPHLTHSRKCTQAGKNTKLTGNRILVVHMTS